MYKSLILYGVIISLSLLSGRIAAALVVACLCGFFFARSYLINRRWEQAHQAQDEEVLIPDD